MRSGHLVCEDCDSLLYGSTYYIQSIAVKTLKKKDKSVGSKSECRPDTGPNVLKGRDVTGLTATPKTFYIKS